jgi:hypothetical protein
MDEWDIWDSASEGLLKSLLVSDPVRRKKVTYKELVRRLESLGVSATQTAIANRLNDGRPQVKFLLQILRALRIEELDLSHIYRAYELPEFKEYPPNPDPPSAPPPRQARLDLGSTERKHRAASDVKQEAVVFLDYDNCLHGEVGRYKSAPNLRTLAGEPLFVHAPILAQALEPYPAVRLVLSTSWVATLGYSRARDYLPEPLRKRVIGATYHSSVGREWWSTRTRYQQIRRYLSLRKPTRWLAIDDDVDGWPQEDREWLVQTAVGIGLSSPSVQRDLYDTLRRAFGADTSDLSGES